MVKFLRQVPYLRTMYSKEIHKLFLEMSKVEYPRRGQIVIREGEKADQVVIIEKGQFEIVKTDVKGIHFNEETAVVGIKE